jgi:hypothetical protein
MEGGSGSPTLWRSLLGGPAAKRHIGPGFIARARAGQQHDGDHSPPRSDASRADGAGSVRHDRRVVRMADVVGFTARESRGARDSAAARQHQIALIPRPETRITMIEQSTQSIDESATAGRLLDKLEAAETVFRFYQTMQDYHCSGKGFEGFETLIADEMTYLSPNFLDTTPVPRDQFLVWFEGIQSVHARPGRGSFFAVSGPVTEIDGDRAHVEAQLTATHWLGPDNQHSTWFYGPLTVDLVRAPDGWRITRLGSQTVRQEGHLPPVNYRHPDLPS